MVLFFFRGFFRAFFGACAKYFLLFFCVNLTYALTHVSNLCKCAISYNARKLDAQSAHVARLRRYCANYKVAQFRRKIGAFWVIGITFQCLKCLLNTPCPFAIWASLLSSPNNKWAVYFIGPCTNYWSEEMWDLTIWHHIPCLLPLAWRLVPAGPAWPVFVRLACRVRRRAIFCLL